MQRRIGPRAVALMIIYGGGSETFNTWRLHILTSCVRELSERDTSILIRAIVFTKPIETVWYSKVKRPGSACSMVYDNIIMLLGSVTL